MKKFLGILLLFIVVVVTVLYFARDFLLKEYLERKMSKANNAPVTIGSVDLDYFVLFFQAHSYYFYHSNFLKEFH